MAAIMAHFLTATDMVAGAVSPIPVRKSLPVFLTHVRLPTDTTPVSRSLSEKDLLGGEQ